MNLFDFYLTRAQSIASANTQDTCLIRQSVKFLQQHAISNNFRSRPNQVFIDSAFTALESSGGALGFKLVTKRLLRIIDKTAGTCCTYGGIRLNPLPLPSIEDAKKVLVMFTYPIKSSCPLPHLFTASLAALENVSELSSGYLSTLRTSVRELYEYSIEDKIYCYSLDLPAIWNKKASENYEAGIIGMHRMKSQVRAAEIVAAYARTGCYAPETAGSLQVPETVRHSELYEAVNNALNQLKERYSSGSFEHLNNIANRFLRFAGTKGCTEPSATILKQFYDEEVAEMSRDYALRCTPLLRELDALCSLNAVDPKGLLLNEASFGEETAAAAEGLSLEQKEACPVETVIAQTRNAITKLGLTVSTVGQYVRAWRLFMGFAVPRHGRSYCHAAADEFLDHVKERFNAGEIKEWKLKLYRRAAMVLKEVAESGSFTWRAFQFVRPRLPSEAEQISNNLLKELKLKNFSKKRIEFYTYVARTFFLHSGISTREQLSKLSEETVFKISRYFRDRCSARSLMVIVPSLRAWYEWLYKSGYVATDFSKLIISTSHVDCHVVPYFTEDDELKIRRALPELDVRNRAIILLALDLGMRNVDILNLRLSNIDWKNDRISIIQHKTGVPASFPLLEEIGNALFEYLTTMRPAGAEGDYVFVRKQAPFRHFESTYKLVSSLCNELGVKPQNGHGIGAHTMRHTLTHRLLSGGKVPHQTITGVLGHKTNQADKSYRSMEEEKLMECALDLSEIGSYSWED